MIKNKIGILVCSALLIVLVTSCNARAVDSSEALQNQINALETQNALLLKDQSSSTSNPSSNNTTSQDEVPLPPSITQDSQINNVTPTIEALPTNPVPAGIPIVFDNWSMTVSPEIILVGVNNDHWGVEVYVRNLGDNNRIFRFTLASVTAVDNLGNVYALNRDCEQSFNDVINYEISSQDSKKISPDFIEYYCGASNGLAYFDEPISLGASQVIITFNGFGPFSNVSTIIDL